MEKKERHDVYSKWGMWGGGEGQDLIQQGKLGIRKVGLVKYNAYGGAR